ncbi:MAG TPA: glycosyltransferase family 4 protein [Solirubrobacteraceae bacterium]|jgi:phosphatidylinositol alpha-1,6-mannosyltransferase|nr:glycosyltransferase family 4 protein [Solirubrobacteraceae bacterium]
MSVPAPNDAASASARRKLRVLLTTPDFPPARGGIQVLAHRLAAGMSNCETTVVTLDSPGAAAFDAASGLATRRVRTRGRSGSAHKAALNAAVLAESLRLRPDAILSAHILTSPAAALAHRLLGVPVVQYFYANEILDKPRLAAFAARRAQRTIAISAYTAQLMAAREAPRERIRLVAPGVDLPAGSPAHDQAVGAVQPNPPSSSSSSPSPTDRTAPAADTSPRRPTILTIARLRDRYKGHDVLIDALAAARPQVPDVQWVVIGDGPRRGELEALARARGVADAVRWLGAVDDAQRDRWLRRADVFAMPSRLPDNGIAGEGFGIVYMEAAAHAVPVVAGNVAGALDAVADGQSGLLVDPTDATAVADAIVLLLRDPQLARRLGDTGAARAQSFAWPAVCRQVEAVLLETSAASASSG